MLNIKFYSKKEQIKEVIKTEGKLKAIKKARQLHGFGLTEAREYVVELAKEI